MEGEMQAVKVIGEAYKFELLGGNMKSLLTGTGILGLLLFLSAGAAKADNLHYSLGEVETTGTGTGAMTSVIHLGSFVLDQTPTLANASLDSSDPLHSFIVDVSDGKGIFSAVGDVTFLKLDAAVTGDKGGLSFLGTSLPALTYALAGPQLYDGDVNDPMMDPGIFKLTDVTGDVYELRVTDVPEPSSLMLLAAGFAAIAILEFASGAKQNS
jgi:hypothetical protein